MNDKSLLDKGTKGKILLVIKKAYYLSKKNDYKETLLINLASPYTLLQRIFQTKSEYWELTIKDNQIVILRYYANLAVDDVIDGNYTKNVRNLLNEFYEIFVKSTKEDYFNKKKSLSKILGANATPNTKAG